VSHTTGDLPEYIERGGDQTYAQPLMLAGTRFYGFIVEADTAALQALCDRYLNGPSGGQVHYRPLVGRVMLGVADIAKITPMNPPDSRIGWIPEVDIAFWVPVVSVKQEGPIFVAERLAWFLPYVFVNNAWAFASGREIFGYPKALGNFEVPSGPDDVRLVTVDTLTFKTAYSGAEAKVERLVECRRTDNGPGGLSRVVSGIEEAAEVFFRTLVGGDGSVTLPGLGVAVEVLDLIVHHEMPLVFLKQFRDIADGARACYQAITEHEAHVTALRSGGLLAGDFRLSVFPFDSHPIVQELGLGGGQVDVQWGWYLDFDFIVENGRVIWQAG
jgi:hypothetical protein